MSRLDELKQAAKDRLDLSASLPPRVEPRVGEQWFPVDAKTMLRLVRVVEAAKDAAEFLEPGWADEEEAFWALRGALQEIEA